MSNESEDDVNDESDDYSDYDNGKRKGVKKDKPKKGV